MDLIYVLLEKIRSKVLLAIALVCIANFMIACQNGGKTVVVPQENNKSTLLLDLSGVVDLKTKLVSKIKAVNKLKDTVSYSITELDTISVAGVSLNTSSRKDIFKEDLKILWNIFYEKEVYSWVRHKKDEKIVVVYSRNKGDVNRDIKITIGFIVKDNKRQPKELNTIVVPATKYAVFFFKGSDENAVSKIWEKVYSSKLKSDNPYNMEVYKVDEYYNIVNSQLWIAQNNRSR